MAKAKSTTKDKTKRPAAAKAAPTRAEAKADTTRAAATGRSATFRQRFNGELVLGSLFAELAGTFVLAVVALSAAGNIILAGVTVIILVMVLSRLSGGHVNPAVTLGLLATRQIGWIRAVGYVVAQLLGAMLAYVVVSQFVHTAPTVIDPSTGQAVSQAQIFTATQLTANEHWRPFFSEALGGLVFGIGVAAAVIGRKNSLESGFVIGGSLMLGLVVATLGSSAIVNPAVALSLSAYQWSNFWSIMTFGIAPIVGVIAGAWFYKLLQWDVLGGKEIKE